jgi:predicted ATP-grasp superfamily ATP-dependent carboligase
MNEKIIAIIIGLGVNGLTTLRSLSRKGIPTLVLHSEDESTEIYAKTRYGQKFIVEINNGLKILEFLKALDHNNLYVLFPTTDFQVRFLSLNRHQIPPFCKINMPATDTVAMLIDKLTFYDYCSKNSYNVPRMYNIQNKHDLQIASAILKFPIIAKTAIKIYKKGLEKAYLINNASHLAEWYGKICSIHSEFIVQEYISGSDNSVYFTLQYITKDGTLAASFTGRKIRQFPPLRGGTSSAEPFFSEYLEKLTYDFFSSVGFYGIGSMEYKLDERDGTYYMIEPTVCRTDFQEGVAETNGINIPYSAYSDLTGKGMVNFQQKKNSCKAWMHLFYDYLAYEHLKKNGKINLYSWLYSIRKVRAFDSFSFDDPMPGIESLTRKLHSKLSKQMEKKRKKSKSQ